MLILLYFTIIKSIYIFYLVLIIKPNNIVIKHKNISPENLFGLEIFKITGGVVIILGGLL